MLGGDHPERDAHQQRHDQCVDGKFKCGGSIGSEYLNDGTAVSDRGAEIAGYELAKVFEVLDQNRAVIAGIVDSLCRTSGGRRPPWAAVMGSPMTLIKKNTNVTRMKTVGMIRKNRITMYFPRPPPDLDLFLGANIPGSPRAPQ